MSAPKTKAPATSVASVTGVNRTDTIARFTSQEYERSGAGFPANVSDSLVGLESGSLLGEFDRPQRRGLFTPICCGYYM